MFNIAIDGPSAAGKSTIAKRLAKQLSYIHLDTGAMYRCCAYATILYEIQLEDTQKLKQLMNAIEIFFDSAGDICLDGVNVAHKIRTNEISMRTSSIAKLAFVREKLVAMQKAMAAHKGYILDGRDIGTVVLPDAEVKIFLSATVEARAKRRYDEYVKQGVDVVYQDIYEDIEERDFQDINREVSPLRKAADAIEIDTSLLSIDQVVEKIVIIINKQTKK